MENLLGSGKKILAAFMKRLVYLFNLKLHLTLPQGFNFFPKAFAGCKKQVICKYVYHKAELDSQT